MGKELENTARKRVALCIATLHEEEEALRVLHDLLPRVREAVVETNVPPTRLETMAGALETAIDELPRITQYLQESLDATETSLAKDHRQWLGIQSSPSNR
jgi:hypothetical protein